MTALLERAFDDWVAEARAVTCVEVADARGLKLSRGNERAGPCPVCGGTDRFAINVRKNLWHCRGSGRGGDAIALVEYLDGADFLGACETLTGSPPPRGEGTRASPEELAAREEARRAREAQQQQQSDRYRQKARHDAYAIWKAGTRIHGTAAESYLARRGIIDPQSRALKYHGDLAYCHGEEEDPWGRTRARVLHHGPALLAAITDPHGWFLGVHMTWIDLAQPDGKVALVDPETGKDLPSRKVRGLKKGGSILLVPGAPGRTHRVFSGEGNETVLSVWMALRATGADLDGSAFIGAVDLGNLAGKALESVPHPTATRADARGAQRRVKVPGPDPDFESPACPIPEECTDLVLLGDGDSERFLTEMAMERARRRHAALGRAVRVAWAPDGKDFNDVLLGRDP